MTLYWRLACCKTSTTTGQHKATQKYWQISMTCNSSVDVTVRHFPGKRLTELLHALWSYSWRTYVAPAYDSSHVSWHFICCWIPTNKDNKHHQYKYRSSTISKLTDYELDNWVSISSMGRNTSLHHHIHTSPGAHPASYPMDILGSFLRGKVITVWS